MTYTAHFKGRRKGAIGIFQIFRVNVDAKSPDEVQLKLYDNYQDIIECIVVRADDSLPLDTQH